MYQDPFVAHALCNSECNSKSVHVASNKTKCVCNQCETVHYHKRSSGPTAQIGSLLRGFSRKTQLSIPKTDVTFRGFK